MFASRRCFLAHFHPDSRLDLLLGRTLLNRNFSFVLLVFPGLLNAPLLTRRGDRRAFLHVIAVFVVIILLDVVLGILVVILTVILFLIFLDIVRVPEQERSQARLASRCAIGDFGLAFAFSVFIMILVVLFVNLVWPGVLVIFAFDGLLFLLQGREGRGVSQMTSKYRLRERPKGMEPRKRG